MALEKKLGIKSKKLPKAFEDDGLGDLLGDLEDGPNSDKKRKRDEDREWLERKRKRNNQKKEEVSSEDDGEVPLLHDDISNGSQDQDDGESSDDMSDGLDDLAGDALDEAFGDEDVLSDDDDGDDYGDDDEGPFDISDEDTVEVKKSRPARENPYVAPGADAAKATQKYVPPSMRGTLSADKEANARLKRQVQGLLNRISDANILSILSDVEKLYQSNPRQYVTSTLIDLLMGLISDRSILENTFLILHAGFISALYKTIGSDFGAQIIERLVEGFEEHYTLATADSAQGDVDAKNKCINVVSLLTQLYNFQVVSSALLFDYVRLFLDSLSEVNTELLLRIVRLSGPQLRSDDPSSLKEIVLSLQKTVANIGEANLSVRTSYMIETITDLKNNRLKTGVVGDQIRTEHAQRMKKTLGTLSNRPNLKATEPLRISLADVKDTDKKGKWWLVGASWKGNEPTITKPPPEFNLNNSTEDTTGDISTPEDLAASTAAISLDALAKASGMNTSVRRAIFISLLSASDYLDAHHRLLRLALTRAQQPEIPRVLLHCAGAEQRYNPYYTLIAKRLCAPAAPVPSSRNKTTATRIHDPDDGESGNSTAGGPAKMQKAFQFALWDLFARMGEARDAADVSEEDNIDEEAEDAANGKGRLAMPAVVNLAKMYGALVASGALPLAVLRKLDLVYLRPKTRVFVEVLLLSLICATRTKGAPKLATVFERTREADGLAAGLQWFLKKVVAKTDLAASDKERKTVQRECRVLIRVLAGNESADDDA